MPEAKAGRIMMEHVERIVSSLELNLTVLRCHKCAAEITLNIESDEQRRALIGDRNDFRCPLCLVDG